MTPICLDAAKTSSLLPMSHLIAAVGRAFDDGNQAPKRLVAHDRDTDWIIMSGLSATGFVCKVVSVAPARKARGLPTIAGSVLAFNGKGDLMVVADAGALTARRTAAIAGHATDLLANPDAGTLALFGTGALAAPHVEAIDTVRKLREVRVVGRTTEKSEAFAHLLRDSGYNARSATTRSAMAGADLVVTVTTSSQPLFSDDMVEPGCHINAMGVYQPDRREIPGRTVGRARIAVEHREAAWTEAGDLIMAAREGSIRKTSVLADFTQPADLAAVRRSPEDVTLFKSLGHAFFDIAAVNLLLQEVALPSLQPKPGAIHLSETDSSRGRTFPSTDSSPG